MVENHAGYSCEKLVWINLERYKKYTQPPLRGFTMLLPLSQTLDPFDSCELVNLAKFHPPVPSLLIVLPPILKISQKNRENGKFKSKNGHFLTVGRCQWSFLAVNDIFRSDSAPKLRDFRSECWIFSLKSLIFIEKHSIFGTKTKLFSP